jgi:hypothetical protein
MITAGIIIGKISARRAEISRYRLGKKCQKGYRKSRKTLEKNREKKKRKWKVKVCNSKKLATV